MSSLWGKASQNRWRTIREKGRASYLRTGAVQGVFVCLIVVAMHFRDLVPHQGLVPWLGWLLSVVMFLFFLAIGYFLGYLGWALIWHFSEKAFLGYETGVTPSSQAAPEPATGQNPALPPAVLEALRNNDKIEAIRQYRAVTGKGLKEAKDFIEGLPHATGNR